ncbi:MAG: hypothetical protein ACPGXL_01735 [Chitinophagales bacterium]
MEQSKPQFESTPNNFQLKNALQTWRNKMLEAGHLTLTDVTELEAHLLDQMDDLAETGLNEQERFHIASLRIGEVKALNQEFAKVNGNQQGQNKLILGIASIALLYLFNQLWYLLLGGVAFAEYYFLTTHLGSYLSEWDIVRANTRLGEMQILSIISNLGMAIGLSFWALKKGGQVMLRFEERLQTKPFKMLGKLLVATLFFVFFNRFAIFTIVSYDGGMSLMAHWAMSKAWANIIQVVLTFVLLYLLLKKQTPSSSLRWNKPMKQLMQRGNLLQLSLLGVIPALSLVPVVHIACPGVGIIGSFGLYVFIGILLTGYQRHGMLVKMLGIILPFALIAYGLIGLASLNNTLAFDLSMQPAYIPWMISAAAMGFLLGNTCSFLWNRAMQLASR